MTSALATAVVVAGIAALFLLDRERTARQSPALWIVVAWMSLAGSRMVSEWLQPGSVLDRPLDGHPLDRAIVAALLAAALGVLAVRRRALGAFLSANGPVLLFFLYGALSTVWSDYPWVASRRWVKASGNVLMVLIVLTELDPAAATRRVLARVGFLLVPLSVLLIESYPALGQQHRWDGRVFFTGVTMGKNALGSVCLVLGLASLWRLLETRRGIDGGARLAHGVVLLMTLWLFWKADSLTPVVCFLVAGGLMALSALPAFARTPRAVHFVVGLALLALLCGAVLTDARAGLLEAVGRESTITGRTALWSDLLRMTVDPVVGTGFESFWLGERLEKLQETYWWQPNHAHNGYLEIFLNLGGIGVALLAIVMVWGYRGIVDRLLRDPAGSRLRLAYLAAAALYNLTEAGFKGMHLVWIAFLLAVVRLPAQESRGPRQG